MSHTQGKLVVYAPINSSGWIDILDENDSRLPVAYVTPATFSETGCPVERRDEETIANAHRLVACWNACDGISTEELEAGLSAGLIRTVRAKNSVERQRDELLHALKAIVESFPLLLGKDWPNLEKARDIIAKTEGSHEQP